MISNNVWICRCRISARLMASADLHKQHCQHRLCIGSCHGDMLLKYACMLCHAMAQLLDNLLTSARVDDIAQSRAEHAHARAGIRYALFKVPRYQFEGFDRVAALQQAA